VAVLLALALGLLTGASVLDKRLEETLREQTRNAQQRARDLQDEVDRQQGFIAEAAPYLVSGRLAGLPVVIVTQEGSDSAALAQARRSLEDSGADIVAVLIVRRSIASPDPNVRSEIAAAIGRPGETASLLPIAADALAERLFTGPERRSASPEHPDMLNALIDGEFIGVGPEAPDSLADVGGPGQAVVVLSGGAGEAVPSADKFMVPLVEGLVKRGVDVAAGEGLDSGYGFVAAVRDDPAVTDTGVVTVDDVDQSIGGVALVLGLDRLVASLDGSGGGNYGVRDGADAVIPPSPSPATAG
jgi:hypothetical protein